MAVLDVELIEESRSRYITYALSVVSSRALPDVRDGLKPVQRRILYAMHRNLSLLPEKPHRKSAAVVGEVLARYHPHGDSACYEAMVRMAQDFNYRYPLIDGQGNFGSLDGDSAAAYRYTEARLLPIALEVVGDIGQETVAERENFDQSQLEPVVLPSRIPQLLVNGAMGIAVGMATAIPPHNLVEVVKALQLLIKKPKASDAEIFKVFKGPDFPTECQIVCSKEQLLEVYSSGSGPITMRADYFVEKAKRKQLLVISSLPYAINKSTLIEKIADIVIAKKLPQILDVRDESTDKIRVVLELAGGANADRVMSYLYKHTPLQSNFYVNLTALVPTENPLTGRPERLSLRQTLNYFIDFREEVSRARLSFELRQLEARAHLLDGLISVFDQIDEVIKIVRKSEGRLDSAKKLQKRFKLSEPQSLYIVDMRIYQLSKTNIDEILAELKLKKKRIREINKLLKQRAALMELVSEDLGRIAEEFGDKRRSKVVYDLEEEEFSEEDFIQHEEASVLVTRDGWIKRNRASSDPSTSRLRDGDELDFTETASTAQTFCVLSNKGNVFGCRVLELPQTSGFGEPVQKLFKFGDGERIAQILILPEESSGEVFMYSEGGLGFRMDLEGLLTAKKSGKRMMRLKDGDEVRGMELVSGNMAYMLSEQGYGLRFDLNDIAKLGGAGKGVILQKTSTDDKLIFACTSKSGGLVELELDKGKPRQIKLAEFKKGSRASRGNKVISRGGPIQSVKMVKK